MVKPRSRSDWLLLAGAAAAIVVAAGLTWFNLTQDKSTLQLIATGIAFLCALIPVRIDLQTSVTARLGGKANTSVLQTWQGWASVIGWGGFDAAILQAVLIDPAWASKTLHFEVGTNLPWAGLFVGMSAMLIIRSKLFKAGNVEWGFEEVYLWSAAQVLDAVNKYKIATKNYWETKFRPIANDLPAYPTLFTDIETHLTGILMGKPAKVQTDLTQEFQRLRASYIPAGAANPDDIVNASPAARRYLISAVLDYLGQDDLVAWAHANHIPL